MFDQRRPTIPDFFSWRPRRGRPAWKDLVIVFVTGFYCAAGISTVTAHSFTDGSQPGLTRTQRITFPGTFSNVSVSVHSGIWVYYTQAGDTLQTVAARFQVHPRDIDCPLPISENELLDPGLELLIPRPRESFPLDHKILSDSEVVYSPDVMKFDVQEYVNQADGFLSTYQEYMRSTGPTSGVEILSRIALENSINPRLLLALLQYQCGCVLGPLADGVDADFLMGVDDPLRKGLYRQLGWVVNQLSAGYYGWRRGLLTDINFRDASPVHLAPDLNAGSVALAYLFANLLDRQGWVQSVETKGGFMTLYQEMFTDRWSLSRNAEPLFPRGLAQPEMILPFLPGKEWGYTSGPHNAWETEGALAALDFAPASADHGCLRSNAWVVAVADGLVVRSGQGAVVLDLDGDGFEGTGWAVLYMHIESRHRVEAGTYVRQGEPIGHPSCEGGPANGTHVHIARKYNGEWIAADGPLPFVMSGWVAQAGYRPFEGSLTRNGVTVVANPLSPAQAFIQRPADDIPPPDKIPIEFWWEE
jgi:LasA protease